MALPFADNEFDAVVCQFGVMFFPDKAKAFAEARHAAGGFTSSPQIETVGARSRAESADLPAFAYCQGTPLRNEIEARGASRIAEAVDVAAAAVAQQFGPAAVDGKIQAHVVTVHK